MCIDDDHEVDTHERFIRIGCGATLGLLVGIGFALHYVAGSYGWMAAVVFVSVVLCAWLALIWGDRFWAGIKDWLPWL